MEAHEKGIEAGLSVLDDLYGSGDNEHAFISALKAYLDASGMVIVPREPRKEMLLAASNEELRQQSSVPGMSAEDRLEYEDAYIAMISAATNPFRKQEEGK